MTGRWLLIVSLSLGACAAEPPGGRTALDSGPWRETLSRPEHRVRFERGLEVVASDGTRLATTVCRPRGDGPHPAVVWRTPYGRARHEATATWLAGRGYAVVLQDVRGRGGSGGAWDPFRHEVDDGADTVAWTLARPWCDGCVAARGDSYEGWAALAAAAGHPGVRAVVARGAMPDPEENTPYTGGVLQGWTPMWLRYAELAGTERAAAFGFIDWNRVWRTLPLGDLDEAAGLESPVLDEWLAHPPSDDDYWRPRRLRERVGAMRCAALHVSGWYDDSLVGAVLHYERMRAGAATPEARAGQRLVIGPWRHDAWARRRVGDVDFGPEAAVDLDAVELRFLDRHLKGLDGGTDAAPRVSLFVLGEDRWRREDDWPPPGVEPGRLHLDGDGVLRPDPPDGAPAPSTLVSDPRDPRPTLRDLNDASESFMTADRSALPARADVLVCTSAPLGTPLTLAGRVRAVLWVSTDAADTDVVVELLRLAPGGRLERLAGGIQRLRARHGPGTDDPVPPGTVVRVEVDAGPVGARLGRGDRIRVEIATTDFPLYARTLHTLEPALTARDPVVATVRIHHDADRPSHVELPVISRSGTAAGRGRSR
ncbi:MAG: CocE/NonD family hydrolase [Planctomycetota bacterium]